MMNETGPLGHTYTRGFASDNYSGAHPEVLEALAGAGRGHASSYGYDPFTQALTQRLRDELGAETGVFPVFNGTAANVLGLQTLIRPYQAVLCPSSSHLNEDECGAPERWLGIKLWDVPTEDGKLRPADIEACLHGRGDEHRVQVAAVSITQPTEWGTLYSVAEIQALSACCRKHGLWLHMDGARISNAVAALGRPLREITVDAGVDVMSFGGTKNGLVFGELVLTFRPELAKEMLYFRKQMGQLHSKMRFISAQFLAFFEGDLWLKSAGHANAMAAALSAGSAGLKGVELAYPTQVNGVFACIPKDWIAPLQAHKPFYIFDPGRNMARWMCSFDTEMEEVEEFLEALRGMG
jgi:threonine aldolase